MGDQLPGGKLYLDDWRFLGNILGARCSWPTMAASIVWRVSYTGEAEKGGSGTASGRVLTGRVLNRQV